MASDAKNWETNTASGSGSRIVARLSNASDGWFQPFEPLRWLKGGHAQTLAGNYWPRAPLNLEPVPEIVLVDSSNNSRVLCQCHWQSERAERLTVVLVHGLEGSSDSQYIRGITALAWSAGCNVIRMNMRNCGGTDSWTPTLYHSGLSGDIRCVLDHFVAQYGLCRVSMVGYSMGGNLVLKLAGELGDSVPRWLVAAVGVSPAADLAASADALHEPANRMYERHFLRNLMRRYRRKTELFPGNYRVNIGPVRSVREFDDRITAPYSGFANADDYYNRASAARVASAIGLPTLVLHALDDPFIRLTQNTRALLQRNPAVTLIETEHGGHCAFLSHKRSGVPNPPRHWAETTLVRYLLATASPSHGS